MTAPHYTPARYIVTFRANPKTGKGSVCTIEDGWKVYPPTHCADWTEAAARVAEEWNAGSLNRHEAAIIARHFMLAAVWADAPEGTIPRPTASALKMAEGLAREFVQSLGVPLFRACLDAYTAEGLHPDCNGEACAAFGHDLLLTLDGHGCGFWSRDALAWDHNPEECARLGLAKGQTIGEKITEACKASRWDGMHGAGYVEFYRGWIHMHEPMRPANT